LPILSLAKEASEHKLIAQVPAPLIHCKIFEDNSGTMEMANVPKMRLRTKHLNIKYHFFRQFVQQGVLQVMHIAGEQQIANIFTKALDLMTFLKHRKSIMGW
jgi:hypothetical protein